MRCIDPTTTGLQHLHDAADHPSVINTGLAPSIGRQKWLQPRKLILCQPKQIAIYLGPGSEAYVHSTFAGGYGNTWAARSDG